MNVEYLIQILNNKMTILNNAKIQSFNNGDIQAISTIDEEILGVQSTLGQLRLLQSIELAAKASNTTSADLINAGLDTVQNVPPTIQGPSASAFINGYDISAYATDPLHEQKIQTIINNMPVMLAAGDIDAYMQNIAEGSPVSGGMVLNAASLYNVDMKLLLAIMQNDSQFGTLGIGARTFNPGNVGNTGFQEQSYPTWQDGVYAVAEWLNRHRIVPVVIPEVQVQPETVVPVEEETPVEDTTPADETNTPDTTDTSTDEVVPEAPVNTVIPEDMVAPDASPVVEPVPEVIPTDTTTDSAKPVSQAKKKLTKKFV